MNSDGLYLRYQLNEYKSSNSGLMIVWYDLVFVSVIGIVHTIVYRLSSQ